jgi:hypothetical protein
LEQKLDSIVTLLRSSQAQNFSESPSQLDPSISPSLPRPISGTSSTPGAGNPASWPTMTPQTLDGSSLAPSCHSWHVDSLLNSDLSSAEADEILHIYQTRMVEYFPFVIVPNGTATRDLRNDKPFLFAAIVMAASRQKIFSQPTAGIRLMEYMSMHMLQNGEKSLDLLQGLLVYIAWFVLYNLGTVSFSYPA